ncbi:hypothetical protein [Anaerobaca lacustris]|uniref:HEAT repeat domain-containing protein n=1 Tax=Anaerobaca lacustris TaxID=3044600 RepID=A0AAW6TSM7_9BACT|nr:hypothetical protein [Sedimentisphaerales bacterium M17dextr]
MARYALLVGVAVVFLPIVSGPLYGWGSATHAYIAREAAGKPGAVDLHVMYGAVLPDAFNIMFGDPYQSSLWTLTHYEFMQLVDEAQSEQDKALAFGFASHNEAWGADRTAHIRAMHHPDSGYVIRKQNDLAAILEPQVRLFLLFSGVPNPSAVTEESLPVVAHTAIETAVDLLIRRNEDPDIGRRLLLAARARGWSAPVLLCKAYAADLAATAGTSEAVAASLIVAAESEFRHQIALYGAALMQADPIDALAEQGAELARLLLTARHGAMVDVPVSLMKEILETAIDVVESDYAAELAATIAYVRQELDSHGVTWADE